MSRAFTTILPIENGTRKLLFLDKSRLRVSNIPMITVKGYQFFFVRVSDVDGGRNFVSGPPQGIDRLIRTLDCLDYRHRVCLSVLTLVENNNSNVV